jgi:uncharacterized membrane protein YebE (DUF533 family)
MTLGDVAQTIGACVLAFNAYQSWRNGRIAKKALAEVTALVPVVKDVAAQTDGLTRQLVKVTGEQKYDEGVKHGEANARSEEEK